MLTLTLCVTFSLFYVIRSGYLLNTLTLTHEHEEIKIAFIKGESTNSLLKKIILLQPKLSLYGLKLYVKIFNLDKRLQAGIYEIKNHYTAVDLLEEIAEGNVLKLPFRIIEGTTFFDVKNNIENASYLKNNHNLWQPNIGCTNNLCVNPEGLVLADTYFYDAGSDAVSILNSANLALQSFLDNIWNTRKLDIPYISSYELLIAASIIEKETAIPSERELISGVIINRIKRGMPLQMDPTVIYAHRINNDGEALARPLLHVDLDLDSPYNTYKHKGLPPTPISIPSRASIIAAAHPADTRYLYYVAKKDGTHEFSFDYNGQKRAINANR